MGKDPFFDREEIEQESTADLLARLRQAEKDAAKWDEENPDPQR